MNCIIERKKTNIPSLTSPFSVSKIFAPLISLCIFPIECRYANPLRVSRQTYAICNSDNGPVTKVSNKKLVKT